MDEHRCAACDVQWTHEPRQGLNALGWGVAVLAAVGAVGMLALIRKGNTGLGGVAAVVSMVCLGGGMWLMGRALPRCPECGGKSVLPPSRS